MNFLNPTRLVAALSLLLSLSTAHAAMLYHVSVDTSAVNASSGYIDLQFNPGDSSAPAATALLSGFGGSITLLPTVTTDGAVTGVLPGSLTFANSTAFNDVFQSVLFGSNFSFDISFDGDFLNASGSTGTSFVVGLYAADGMTSLLTTDLNGTVLTSELVPGGVVTHTTFAADVLGSPSVVAVTPVPLPAGVWLLLSGLSVLPWWRKRRV